MITGLLFWQKIRMLMSLKIHSGFAAALVAEQFLFIPFVAKVQRHIKYIRAGSKLLQLIFNVAV